MTGAVIISGFVLGAAGSLHCVGMCGPLSLALPTHDMSFSKKIFSLLSYNLGRVATYSVLGLLLGSLGAAIYSAGFRQRFSIIIGVIIFLLAVLYIAGRHFRTPFLKGFYEFIQQQTATVLRRVKSPTGFFLFGVMNGLLPCGMIYMAIAGALSFGDAGAGTLFMAMFGLGTLPAMLGFGLASRLIKINTRRRLNRLTPWFVGVVAIILIIRGLNVDLPFFNGSSAHHGMTIPCSR